MFVRLLGASACVLALASSASANGTGGWQGRFAVSIGVQQNYTDWNFDNSGGITRVELNDPSPLSPSLTLSYGIAENFTVFGSYTSFEYGKQASIGGRLVNPLVSAEVFTLGVTGYLPFSDMVYGFGQLGVSRVAHEEDLGSSTLQTFSNNLMVGFGMGAHLTDEIFMELGYQRHGGNGGSLNGLQGGNATAVETDYSNISLSLGYRF